MRSNRTLPQAGGSAAEKKKKIPISIIQQKVLLMYFQIFHSAKLTPANSKTARIIVLHVQLCKQKSGTVAQTQIESLPDISVQV